MSLLGDYQRLMLSPEDESAPAAEPRPAQSSAAPESHDLVTGFVEAAHAALTDELIARIHAQQPAFFERLVIDVLLAMGYGSNRAGMAQCLGRSGDGGIDGVITLDELGFDLIYIQAKRLKPGVPVPITDVRDFAGTLESRHASKGVFVTTTHFSAGAAEFCSRLTRRVVLIDGTRLAHLMVRYNIGVVVQHCYVLKGLDRAYFALPPGLAR